MSVTHFTSHAGNGRVGLRMRFSNWLAERRLRRDINAVEAFDDALLHDIGVSRSEIEDAVRHGRARRR